MISMAGDRLRRMISGAVARPVARVATVFAAIDVRFAQKHDERMQSRSSKAWFAMDQQIGTQLAFSGSDE
jgi:hypothetical protein